MSSGMFEEGFLFDQLSEAKQNLLRSIAKVYPEEAGQFVKEEARKLMGVAKKVAKQEVGTSKGKKKNWKEKTSYHKGFKVGKKYDYNGDTCCRAYNASPHGHLVEYGHLNIPRGQKRATTREGRKNDTRKASGFTLGKYVFDIASLDFEPESKHDCEKFLMKYVDDTIRGKF